LFYIANLSRSGQRERLILVTGDELFLILNFKFLIDFIWQQQQAIKINPP